MASAAQITANQENARKSTGPRTEDGKARSSQNARKHGFNSKRFIIRDDEREDFEELRESLTAELDPRGALAETLFQQLLHANWNLLRIQRVEAELFDGVTDPLAVEKLHKQMELLARYHARYERSFHTARRALKEHQTNQVGLAQAVPPGDLAGIAALTDVHSLHKARKNALKAYDETAFPVPDDPLDKVCTRWEDPK